MRRIEDLYSQIGRLTTKLTWLQKNLASTWTRAERVEWIDWDHADLPIATQAALLGLKRTSLYYLPAQVSADEVAIKNQIDGLYTAHPFYGSRKIAAVVGINRKAAQRHMREMGIAGICPGPNLSKRCAVQGLFPYLLSGLVIDRPNQVLGVDAPI